MTPDLSTTSARPLTITVNGEERTVDTGATVRSLLETLQLQTDAVAVEINRRLVRTPDYGRPLCDGETIEIVTFVGGG